MYGKNIAKPPPHGTLKTDVANEQSMTLKNISFPA